MALLLTLDQIPEESLKRLSEKGCSQVVLCKGIEVLRSCLSLPVYQHTSEHFNLECLDSVPDRLSSIHSLHLLFSGS